LDGASDGTLDGLCEGNLVGIFVLGPNVGDLLGLTVGAIDGLWDGYVEGCAEGCFDRVTEGNIVGSDEGANVEIKNVSTIDCTSASKSSLSIMICTSETSSIVSNVTL
jgi:hypothetical protein